MGIYISEINMPKGDGSKLVLQIFPNGEVYDEHGIRLGITNWAEAISVPLHGRLIDADKMQESIKRQAGFLKLMGGKLSDIAETLEKGFLQEIANAPTIIEAEEE